MGAAKALIHHSYLNEGRALYEKNLRVNDRAEQGVGIVASYHWSAGDEAKWMLEQIGGLLQNGCRPEDIYVLHRTNAGLALPEELLSNTGIPNVSTSGSYWQNGSVQEVLGIVKLAYDSDNDEAFQLVYDIPSPQWELSTRRLGRVFLKEVEEQGQGTSLWAKMLSILPMARPFRRKGIVDFMNYIDRIKFALAHQALTDVVAEVAADYSEYLKKREGPDAVEELEILEPLPFMVARYPDWPSFIAMTKQLSEAASLRKMETSVVLSTIHRVKGLERKVVFGVGMSEGILPHWMATGESIATAKRSSFSRDGMPPSSYNGRIEDERCAAYVLLTRAKEQLYLSGVRVSGAKVKLPPSRFIWEMELDKEATAGVREALAAFQKEERGEHEDI